MVLGGGVGFQMYPKLSPEVLTLWKNSLVCVDWSVKRDHFADDLEIELTIFGGPGEKPERRHPSSIKISRYWWGTDTGVKIVTFWIAANMMAQNGKWRIQVFNIWCRRQEKKAEFAPFCSAPSYLRRSGRHQF